jgi:subtilase family serine protease
MARLPRVGGLAAVAAAGLLAAACSASAPAAAPASPAASGSVTPGHVPDTHPVAPGAGAPAGIGLSPADLARAYDLGPLWRRGIDGTGQTIVIVDSFGSPTITTDLAHFDAAFGLRPPASLSVIQPAGPVPAFRPSTSRTGWAAETSLDVEWAHAMAPGAHIVLAETPTDETEGIAGFPQIVTAENYVLAHHLGQVISQSFGATEQTFTSRAQLLSLRGPFELAQRDHVTVLAASGDTGSSGETLNMKSLYPRQVVEWPASDPLVTAVGGTQLQLGPGGARAGADVAWAKGGGGRSAVFARPSWQDGVASVTGAQRGIPDISMNASCGSSVAVYATFPGAGSSPWQGSCGTSLATPLFAGVVALAAQQAGHGLGLINPALYQMYAARDPGIVDVRSGNNAVTFSGSGGTPVAVPGFTAAPGFDLASGIGTVNAALFVPELAHLDD